MIFHVGMIRQSYLDLEVTVHEREKVIFGYDLRWVMQEPVYIFLSCSF